MSKFTVYNDKQNEFRWKFAANDNTVIAKSSQGYKAKEDCVSSLNLLKKDIAGATVDYPAAGAAGKGPVAPSKVESATAKGSSPVPASNASPAAGVAPRTGGKN